MKLFYACIFLLLSTACNQHTDPIEGEWKLNSRFYSATYKIAKERNQLNGLVLYYNDGTTKYKHDGSSNYYFFTGLKKQANNHYIDGISGATSKNEISENIEIKYKSTDTLEVTSQVLNKPLVEIWTRNKRNEKENN